MRVPSELSSSVSSAVRPAGYRREGRRSLWSRGGPVITAVAITAVDQNLEEHKVWLSISAHAVAEVVVLSHGGDPSDPHYANFISWTVDQQSFGGPPLYEYNLQDPATCSSDILTLVTRHLVPACDAMAESDSLYSDLKARVSEFAESPALLSQFVHWALSRGSFHDAALAMSANLQADNLSYESWAELTSLRDRFPGFQPPDWPPHNASP